MREVDDRNLLPFRALFLSHDPTSTRIEIPKGYGIFRCDVRGALVNIL